jgi:hypothetical protein
MNPDPPPPFEDPQTGAQLAYGLGALEIVITEVGTGTEWLKGRFSIWEPDWIFRLPNGQNVLSIPNKFENSAFTVVTSRFAGCPKVAHGIWEPPVNCERGFEASLGALLGGLIAPNLLTMLSEIPVPNVWDANGVATAEVELDGLGGSGRYQMNQNVTFFADIPNG